MDIDTVPDCVLAVVVITFLAFVFLMIPIAYG